MVKLIDRNGNPYVEGESFPAGGGLDARCEHNEIALKAYDLPYEKLDECLERNGFVLLEQGDSYEVWQKGNTIAVYEDFIEGYYGYMYTRFKG